MQVFLGKIWEQIHRFHQLFKKSSSPHTFPNVKFSSSCPSSKEFEFITLEAQNVTSISEKILKFSSNKRNAL